MTGIIGLLETYKYFVLFPLAIIEGPILTVIAGFLVTLGLMNPYIVFPIVVVADSLGDSLCYALGRFGEPLVRRHGHWIGITTEKLLNAEEYFKTHHLRSILMSKLIHGIGFVGIIAAGSLRVRYGKFALTALAVSAAQTLVFLILGIFFGFAYVTIEKYLSYFAAVASLITLFVAFIIVLNVRFKK